MDKRCVPADPDRDRVGLVGTQGVIETLVRKVEALTESVQAGRDELPRL